MKTTAESARFGRRYLGTLVAGLAATIGTAAVARADMAPLPPRLFLFPRGALAYLFVAMAVALLIFAVHQANRARTPKRPHRVRSAFCAAAALSLSLLCALVALPNFLSFRLKPRTSEAKSNLGAIGNLEVAYMAEWDRFVGDQPPTPAADRRRNAAKIAWATDTRFSVLGFAPEGNVRCSYSLEGPLWPSKAEGFTARAECDLDEDGELAVYTITRTSVMSAPPAIGAVSVGGDKDDFLSE